MTMIHYSDHAIVEGLRLNSDFIIKYVYKEFFPTIRFLVKSNTGFDEDAEDIFQEALFIVLKKLQNEDFELSSSFLTYLYSISRNLWLQKLKRKRQAHQNQDDLERYLSNRENSVDSHYDEHEKYKLFQEYFDKMSPDCQRLMKLFLTRMPLREIAEEMGYKSEDYAKTKKYLCKESLKKLIENDPRLQDLIA
jgi:RNA polymerase sigma factor (sigma-70 family)